MDKKKVKVVEYSNHPEMEGDELKVVIIGNEKRKPRMRTAKGPRKPKQPRMTIMQLAIEMRAGFVAINKEIADIKVTLQRHEDILNKHTEILERHELIFERNNLK
ncbi:MAG: hypothetical protein LBB45_04450 [Methanobrevibacter sp.]|jgi:hypothetical protein|nr:hypothetical protein [Candidatus Methanovirga basalitermitum]